MSDIKPCPFCGGEAEVQFFGLLANVGCTKCGIMTKFVRIDGIECEVEKWNTRVENTCTIEYEEHYQDTNENCFYLSCGHEVKGFSKPNYCIECGAKVVEE